MLFTVDMKHGDFLSFFVGDFLSHLYYSFELIQCINQINTWWFIAPNIEFHVTSEVRKSAKFSYVFCINILVYITLCGLGSLLLTSFSFEVWEWISNFISRFTGHVVICPHWESYRQASNISCIFVGNKIVDHSDVVGAAPVGAAPTTSSFFI